MSKDETEIKEKPVKNNDEEKNNKINSILIGIILVMLVFFLGERYIDRRSETEISIYSEIASKALTETAGSSETEKVNINTADIYELQKLSGIGEKKASDIIEYRYVYGEFDDISEIKNVPGIGDGIFEKIKNDITV